MLAEEDDESSFSRDYFSEHGNVIFTNVIIFLSPKIHKAKPGEAPLFECRLDLVVWLYVTVYLSVGRTIFLLWIKEAPAAAK